MYQNFIPVVESAALLKELESHFVMALHTNREYEGEVKEKGDSVRILCVNKPTIHTLNDKETYSSGDVATNSVAGTGRQVIQKGIGDAEELDSSTITMQINQLAYYHYSVGDIDKEQSEHKEVWAKRKTDAGKEIARVIDKYIAYVMATNPSTQVSMADYTAGTTKITADATTSGKINALDFIDNLVETFNKNDVSDSTDLIMEVSPTFWKVLKKSYRDLDTNNTGLLKARALGIYNGVQIVKTTACYDADKANGEYVFIHTDSSVAFANPLAHSEAYRPEKAFCDVVKGFVLYDAKVIRPKELISAKVVY